MAAANGKTIDQAANEIITAAWVVFALERGSWVD
jgi:hypothetical protein